MNGPTVMEYERRNGEAISSVQRLNWTVILFMLAQTAGAIWWASSTHAAIHYLTSQITELKVELKAVTKDRYTALDAQRDSAYLLEGLVNLKERVSRLETRVYPVGEQ